MERWKCASSRDLFDLVSRHASSSISPPPLKSEDGDVSERSGERLALWCSPTSWVTYLELVSRARHMTAIIEPILQLHTNGHDGTPLVLVRTEREACLIVALLGILGSGAAFVPMDPEHPLSRQRLIAECSEATLAVVSLEIWTKESHQGAKDLEWRNLLGPFVRTVVCIDRRGAPIKTIQLGTLQDAGAADEDANEDKVHEARPPGVAGLAYVMFTSGSTGVPKGVLVRASGVGALLYSFAHHNPNLVEGGFGCCGRSTHHKDALLAVTTVAFDISVLELLLPLVTGATLVLASPTASRSASALTSMLNFGTTEQSYQASSVESSGGRPQPRITMMQATPATWRMICGVDGGWRGREEPWRAEPSSGRGGVPL